MFGVIMYFVGYWLYVGGESGDLLFVFQFVKALVQVAFEHRVLSMSD